MCGKVKELIWFRSKVGDVRCTESKDETRLTEDEDITNRWEEHVRKLYRHEE